MSKRKVGAFTVELSNENKILFPKDEITKGQLIDYYQRIAPIMLPYMRGRPVTMHRFPDGIGKEGFYHKDAPDYIPKWIRTVKVKKVGGVVHHIMCDHAATLVWLANYACITPHIWLSRHDKVYYPDRMIFDLDPPDTNFGLVRVTAKKMRKVLEEIGLVPFMMTTGSKGVHIVVPIKRMQRFDFVRSVARAVAQILIEEDPKHLTMNPRKEARRGKLFLDTARNSYAQTGVAPYAVRARMGAPVATPLFWEELNDAKLVPTRYTIKNIFRRLARKDDPWKGINTYARALKKPEKIIKALLSEFKK